MSNRVYNKQKEINMAGWSARALSRRTGIPVATVASWIKSDLVSVEQYGRGRGGHTVGVSGLMELLAVEELRRAGFSMPSIRKAMYNLRELSGHERPFARLMLLVVGSDIAWMDADQLADIPISALHQPGQRLMLFPVGQLHRVLVHQLAEDAAIDTTNLDLALKSL
jgi:hypothetical protein